MSNLKLLSKILRLKEMKITHFEFKNHDKELRLTVNKPPTRMDAAMRPTWLDRMSDPLFSMRGGFDAHGDEAPVWYAPKEIDCPTHGRVQETIP